MRGRQGTRCGGAGGGGGAGGRAGRGRGRGRAAAPHLWQRVCAKPLLLKGGRDALKLLQRVVVGVLEGKGLELCTQVGAGSDVRWARAKRKTYGTADMCLGFCSGEDPQRDHLPF